MSRSFGVNLVRSTTLPSNYKLSRSPSIITFPTDLFTTAVTTSVRASGDHLNDRQSKTKTGARGLETPWSD
jgi:hypothetical protein